MASRQSEITRLARIAERAGWVVKAGKKHLKWYAPDGRMQFVTSTSPSDHAAINGVKRDLRRRGVEIP